MSTLPAIFLGHGSPMNAINDSSRFNRGFFATAAAITRPEAILMVSAHWFGRELRVMSGAHNPILYDFSGFPPRSIRRNTRRRARPHSLRASVSCWRRTASSPMPAVASTTAPGRCCAISTPPPTCRWCNSA